MLIKKERNENEGICCGSRHGGANDKKTVNLLGPCCVKPEQFRWPVVLERANVCRLENISSG